MQRLGMNTAYVGMNLRTALTGNDDAMLTDGGTEYPIRVRVDVFDRQDYDDMRQLTVVNPAGIPLGVSQFAEIRRDRSPSLLEREDRQPAVILTAAPRGLPSGT